MDQVKTCIFTAVFYFSALSFGFSETVVLKSGQEIEGKIIEQTDKYVKLEFQGIELVYYQDEIASINQEITGRAEAMSPQLESLYKAYTSSLQAPKKSIPPETLKTAEPASESKPDTQDKQAIESVASQEKIAGVDITKLPPGVQKAIKEALAKKQIHNSMAQADK